MYWTTEMRRLATAATAVTMGLVLVGLLAAPAQASHFRYGNLSWAPTNVNNQILFQLEAAFRRSGYSGTAPDLDPAVGDIILETVGGTGLNFGDGSSTGILRFEVIAIDPAGDVLIGRALNPGTDDQGILYTYNGPGPYTATVASCCRIGGLNNRSSGSYRLETVVTLDGNSSPTTTLVPIVSVDESATASFFVPASDPNGDDIRYRLATEGETTGGGVYAGPPNLNVDPITGQVTWNNVGLNQTNFWTAQIIIEDFTPGGVVKTRTPVDFLLIIEPVQGNPPVCTITPSNSFTVDVGQAVSFTVTGTDADPGATVTINTGGLPGGATMTPTLPVNGPSGTNSVFNWTPSSTGSSNVIFSVTDNDQNQSLCSATIRVQQPTGGDTTPPVCGRIVPEFNGPGGALSAISTSASDPESGIASVMFTSLVNLEGYVDGNGPFAQGATYDDATTPNSVAIRGERISYATGGRIVVKVTNGEGLSRNCDPVVAELSSSVPERTALGTSYPNPFSATSAAAVRVPLQLAETADVRVTVYDVLGREVTVLANRRMDAGSYEVIWPEVASLPAGTYIVHMTAGTFHQTQRLTLVE